jgi:hypothetical protein
MIVCMEPRDTTRTAHRLKKIVTYKVLVVNNFKINSSVYMLDVIPWVGQAS